MNPTGPSDLPDLHALQDGDDTALNRLIERWEKPLFSYAWRYVRNTADAQDLTAETFVRLYQQRQRLKRDTRLSAWLFTTLTNLCHNHHRWKQRHPSVSLDDEPAINSLPRSGLTPELAAPDTALEKSETLSALSAAIDRLPHDLKTTLLLHHYEHLSYREIGEITGCSERGVETRLYRARNRLREELSLSASKP